jgi:hypothetical protein
MRSIAKCSECYLQFESLVVWQCSLQLVTQDQRRTKSSQRRGGGEKKGEGANRWRICDAGINVTYADASRGRGVHLRPWIGGAHPRNMAFLVKPMTAKDCSLAPESAVRKWTPGHVRNHVHPSRRSHLLVDELVLLMCHMSSRRHYVPCISPCSAPRPVFS